MPRRSKRSLKAVAQNSEKGKGFGPVVTIIGTSPTSVVSIHYLDLLIYCNLCVPFEDLSDVVGEDLDEEDNRDWVHWVPLGYSARPCLTSYVYHIRRY